MTGILVFFFLVAFVIPFVIWKAYRMWAEPAGEDPLFDAIKWENKKDVWWLIYFILMVIVGCGGAIGLTH